MNSLKTLAFFLFLAFYSFSTQAQTFKFGIKGDKKRSLISIGSVVTTSLIIISSYFFGIWVLKFSKYNELYGSIGTLLIVMFYIWLSSMVLLLGFDLNASINHIKREKQKELDTL